jgi:hypothetical protein
MKINIKKLIKEETQKILKESTKVDDIVIKNELKVLDTIIILAKNNKSTIKKSIEALYNIGVISKTTILTLANTKSEFKSFKSIVKPKISSPYLYNPCGSVYKNSQDTDCGYSSKSSC